MMRANVRKPAPAWALSLMCAARGGLSWVLAGIVSPDLDASKQYVQIWIKASPFQMRFVRRGWVGILGAGGLEYAKVSGCLRIATVPSFYFRFRNRFMPRSIKFLSAFAVASIAACGSDSTAPTIRTSEVAIPTVAASRSSSNIVVTESDIARQIEDTPPTRSWVFYYRVPTSTGSFVSGPGTPPLRVW